MKLMTVVYVFDLPEGGSVYNIEDFCGFYFTGDAGPNVPTEAHRLNSSSSIDIENIMQYHTNKYVPWAVKINGRAHEPWDMGWGGRVPRWQSIKENLEKMQDE